MGDVPTNPDALHSWLEAARYRDWDHERAIHPTAGPHGPDVRVWFNPQLAASLSSDNTVQVPESAAVEEIYDHGRVMGWTVLVKASDGAEASDWYWYELFDRAYPNVRAEGEGLEPCASCHSAGRDFVMSRL